MPPNEELPALNHGFPTQPLKVGQVPGTFTISTANPPGLHETVEERADRMHDELLTRVRSHDEMVPAKETKRRLRACRLTTRIGDTVFRCEERGPHTTHRESGTIFRGKGFDTNVDYELSWIQVDKKVIRNG